MSNANMQTFSKGSVAGVFTTFLKLGLTSFGGPIAHFGYFHKELIEKQSWLSDTQFSQLLAICQFLPGPASSQLGFVLGLLRAGWRGALAAFLAFTLPSALLLVGFASVLPFLSNHIGEATIHGLKLVAFAVVADAIWSMSKKLCPDLTRRIITVLAVIAMLLITSAWSQILVITGGGIAGVSFCRVLIADTKDQIQVSYGKPLGLILFTIFIILLTTVAFIPNPFSQQSELYNIAQVFYRAGALVFGGGHVVLPLLQDSVVTSGLVSNENFLAGYGASQAIPGPMFAFSAYLGAIMPAAVQVSWLGAIVALAFLFLPGFLLVMAVLPMWQSVSNNATAINAIAGINAAVVGLLIAALYNPILTSGVTNGYDLAIGVIGLTMLRAWRLSPLFVVVWCVITSVGLALNSLHLT